MTPKTPLMDSGMTLRPRVLVVDDEPKLLELFDDIISPNLNCRLINAHTIEEAERILASEPIELLVTDVHLPDGNGAALIASLRRRQPHASAIVITGQPSLDGAISALRYGALDFIPKPFSADQMIERVRSALERQAMTRKKEKRLTRLRNTVKRLNEARKVVSKKVDLLCNDLVTAYGDLSKQLDTVRMQESFRQLLHEAKDLEQMLCHAMDWLLRQLGYSNVALWLASDEAEFQLGAYMKYNIAGEPPMTDAMEKGLLPLIVRESFVNLSGQEARERLTPPELLYLSDQTILGVNCTYLGESLATIVLFRDSAKAFTDEDAAMLKIIAPIFATSLAGMVHGGSEDHEPPESPFYSGDSDVAPPRPRKNDPADWWKRGESPPF